jgi:hypothetical protein
LNFVPLYVKVISDNMLLSKELTVLISRQTAFTCTSMDLPLVTSAVFLAKYIHIHTYHSRLIPEGVAEASQIFLRGGYLYVGTFYQITSYDKYCRLYRW